MATNWVLKSPAARRRLFVQDWLDFFQSLSQPQIFNEEQINLLTTVRAHLLLSNNLAHGNSSAVSKWQVSFEGRERAFEGINWRCDRTALWEKEEGEGEKFSSVFGRQNGRQKFVSLLLLGNLSFFTFTFDWF